MGFFLQAAANLSWDRVVLVQFAPIGREWRVTVRAGFPPAVVDYTATSHESLVAALGFAVAWLLEHDGMTGVRDQLEAIVGPSRRRQIAEG